MTGTPWRVLALTEAARMVRHPAFIVAALALALPWGVQIILAGPVPFPTLTNASWEIQLPMLIVAAGAYFAGLLTGIRDYRHATVEFESVQPMPRWKQASAQLAAVTAPAAVAAVMTAVYLLALSTATGSSGGILPAAAATVPATVLLAAGLGVTVAHVAHTLSAGVLAFAVIAVVTLAGLIDDRQWRWLSPTALEDSFAVPAVPRALAERPDVWHVLWLLALTTLAASLTVLVNGLARRVCLSAATVAALALAISGIAQLSAPPLQQTVAWRAAFDRPSALQTCQKRGPMTYCAFPDFTSRIDAWNAIVVAQRAALPGRTSSGFVVRQRLSMPPSGGNPFMLPTKRWDAEDAAAGTPGTLPISTRWADPGSDSYDQEQVLAFALGTAQRLLTGERPVPTMGGVVIELCGGRGLATLWLATQTSPAGRGATEVVLDRGYPLTVPVLDSMTSFAAGFVETDLLERLLARPDAAVRTAITEHWSSLLAPSTTVEDAAKLLGVEGLSAPPADVGLCAR